MNERITPCLWFNGQAKEAGNFYCSIFKQTKIVSQSPVVTEIEVSRQNITLLDGGPKYEPNASISLFYICETEAEIEGIYNSLLEEGEVLMPLDQYEWSEKYAWINDKYGVSWQLSLGDIVDVGQRVTPCFMFTGNQYGKAKEAMEYYSSVFKHPKLDGVLYYTKNEAPEEEGKVKHAQIAFNGQKFMFMDSIDNQDVKFSEGVSLTIHCETQEAIDYYWG